MLAKPEQTPDLDLRALEPPWIEHVEAAPEIAEREDLSSSRSSGETADAVVERPSNHDPVVPPAGLLAGYEPQPLSVLERSRSAVWPLVLALVVGLAIGFAGGYGVGSHERSGAGLSAGAPPVGREFTEGAVAAAAPVSPVAPPATVPKSEISNLKSPVSAGQLLVRSRPAGAQVSVDGHDYGRTPVTVRELAHGAHRVRITHDGYTAEERRIVISASRPSQTMTLALVRPRGRELPGSQRTAPAPVAAGRLTGALRVESRPPGAAVYLDGKLLGKTPFSVPVVPAGDHAIRLERDGYRRWSSSIRIVASEQNRVTASLER